MNQRTSSEIDGHHQTTILFVDDEPLVLEGLRRIVYTEFVADLASGPEEGLTKLKQHGPYPIVVSDMRMPGMDGAKFLALVRTISPESIRVMLTGYHDMEAATRAVNEGQIFRFLTKPVPSDTLLATLRACVVQYHAARLEKEQLKITIDALEQLDLGTLTPWPALSTRNQRGRPATPSGSHNWRSRSGTPWVCPPKVWRSCIAGDCCMTSERSVRPQPFWTRPASSNLRKCKSCETM